MPFIDIEEEEEELDFEIRIDAVCKKCGAATTRDADKDNPMTCALCNGPLCVIGFGDIDKDYTVSMSTKCKKCGASRGRQADDNFPMICAVCESPLYILNLYLFEK